MNRRAPGAQPIGLLLPPPALDAFHTLHHTLYDAYAYAHLSPQAAAAAVRTAFGLLAADWIYVLAQPNPNAIAWNQLVACTGSRHHPLPHITTQTPLQYDALVLTRLGHTPTARETPDSSRNTIQARVFTAPF
ncbi:hypothetical protein [Streptomyces sp. NPDC008121]|uniref:hypothetical protein n=1 Tax=Streptomyces sp. NPDC008121 TaxID=3364809 RepID=UPI0036F03C0B